MKSTIVEGVKAITLWHGTARALLISPPVYDVRLSWAPWHHPVGLLQIGAYLLQQKKDVRLIDCLYSARGRRLERHKIGSQEVEDYKISRWHFGLPFEKLEKQVRSLTEEDWMPDKVFVTSLNSIWWEAARDTIAILKRLLPGAEIVLGGAYPTVAPEHAEWFSGADIIVCGNIPDLLKVSTALSLYREPPYSTGIFFYETPAIYPKSRPRPRGLTNIVIEIKKKARIGIREFVFFDEEIRVEDRDQFGKLLDRIAEADLDVHFVLPGTISPRVITQDFARKLRRASFTQVYLRCDLDFTSDPIRYTTTLADYERCINALTKRGGFELTQGNIAAMLVAGMPYEDLDAVCERLVRLAHIAGSVILVPFQYVPGLHNGPLFDRALAQNGSFAPDRFNSKWFPLVRLSGKKLEEYFELIRLAALLNSKHWGKTFDFLGDGLAAKMFRESIRTEGWNPFAGRATQHELAELVVVAPSLTSKGGI